MNIRMLFSVLCLVAVSTVITRVNAVEQSSLGPRTEKGAAEELARELLRLAVLRRTDALEAEKSWMAEIKKRAADNALAVDFVKMRDAEARVAETKAKAEKVKAEKELAEAVVEAAEARLARVLAEHGAEGASSVVLAEAADH